MSSFKRDRNRPLFRRLISSPSGQPDAYSISFHVKTEKRLESMRISRSKTSINYFPVDPENNEDIKAILAQYNTGYLAINLYSTDAAWYSAGVIAGDSGSFFLLYAMFSAIFIVRREKNGERKVIYMKNPTSDFFLFYKEDKDELFYFGDDHVIILEAKTLKIKRRQKLEYGVIFASIDERENFALVSSNAEFFLLDSNLEPLVKKVRLCANTCDIEAAVRHPAGYYLIVLTEDDRREIRLYRPDFTLAHTIGSVNVNKLHRIRPNSKTCRFRITKLTTEIFTGRVLAQVKGRKRGPGFWTEVKIKPFLPKEEDPESELEEADVKVNTRPEALWLAQASMKKEGAGRIQGWERKMLSFCAKNWPWTLAVGFLLFCSYLFTC